MKIVLNTNCTPFIDKEGKYVEVISVLPTKVVLLYSNDTVIPETISNTGLELGDKIYFKEDGTFNTVVKKQLQSTVTSSNKQSPYHLPKDSYSRF